MLEKSIFNQHVAKQKIKYEKLDLLKVDCRILLRNDLENRIGAKVIDVKVESVNYVEGSATMIVKYRRDNNGIAHHYVFPNQSQNGRSKEEKLLVKGI